MLQVLMMTSGRQISALRKEDFKDLAAAHGEHSVRCLKEHLAQVTGQPRFKQRILHAGAILLDDARLELPVVLHLVFVPFCADARYLELFNIAISLDFDKVVEAVLQHPQDPNAILDGGRTCLGVAASHGSLKSATLLLEARADLEKPGRTLKRVPLNHACLHGQTDFVRWLLESHADPDKSVLESPSPLEDASIMGCAEIVRILLEAHADVNAPSISGTPLHIACAQGEVEVARLLLHGRADVTMGDRMGLTALHVTCVRSQLEAARLLLQHRAEAEQACHLGYTALH